MTTCNDQMLEALLGADIADDSLQDTADHVETCVDCQTRLGELAAQTDDWREAKEWLSTAPDDEASREVLRDRPWYPCSDQQQAASWSDSMASQLLAPPSHPEMLGRIGRYEVERLIGSGGMGVVFKGSDTELNRPVAIKVLAPYLAGSGAARQRFSREARAAAAVVDEHVVAIHNVESDAESPFLVMQFVAGESLQARLDRCGPLEVREVLRIGMQTASGLAAAHAQGLIHRDVKPSNILLEDGVDRALLTDFGLARAADDASLTRTGYHPGTPQYMSPEQARGTAVDQRSDLFSLGTVLYAMCTGRTPFRAETSYGVLRRITDDQPTPIRELNSDIPDWLCQIIETLMSKQPTNRYESAAFVAELLGDCLAHVQQPARTRPPHARINSRKPKVSSTRPTLPPKRLGMIAVIAAFGFGLLGMFLWQSSDPPSIAGRWAGEGWHEVHLELQRNGKYQGSYTDISLETDPHSGINAPEIKTQDCRKCHTNLPRGKIEMKWSRLERRFNGTWHNGHNRSGKISLRLLDDEIRGAWTTSKSSNVDGALPRLADLAWQRVVDDGAAEHSPSASTRRSSVTASESEVDRIMPSSPAERAVSRLVLVFFQDRSRRAVPAVVVSRNGQSFAITTGPATMVPDDSPPAIDRIMLELADLSFLEPEYLEQSTPELFLLRVPGHSTTYAPDFDFELKVGDRLSAILPAGTADLHVTPNVARVTAMDGEASLYLPTRKTTQHYDQLITIDQALPEGTPVFKDGKLAGLTLLGTRYLDANSHKSFVVPLSRIQHALNSVDENAIPKEAPTSARVSKSIVRIGYNGWNENARVSGFGVGLIVDDKGHILVPSHIVPGMEEEQIMIRYESGRVVTNAKRVGTIEHLTVLEAESSEYLVPIALADDVPLAAGDSIAGILNSTDPVVGKVLDPQKTIVISSGPGWEINPPARFYDVIETNLKPDKATHSGAPLVTRDGRLSGMLINYQTGDGLFAIPLSVMRSAVKQLLPDAMIYTASEAASLDENETDKLIESKATDTLELVELVTRDGPPLVATTYQLGSPDQPLFERRSVTSGMTIVDLTDVTGHIDVSFKARLLIPQVTPRGGEYVARNTIRMWLSKNELQQIADGKRLVRAFYYPGFDLKASNEPLEESTLRTGVSQEDWLAKIPEKGDLIAVLEVTRSMPTVAKEPDPTIPELLQGTWHLESEEQHAAVAASRDPNATPLAIVIDGTKLTGCFDTPWKPITWEIEFDSKQRPQAIYLSAEVDGSQKKQAVRFRLDEDELLLCFDRRNPDRLPVELRTARGSNAIIWRMSRAQIKRKAEALQSASVDNIPQPDALPDDVPTETGERGSSVP